MNIIATVIVTLSISWLRCFAIALSVHHGHSHSYTECISWSRSLLHPVYIMAASAVTLSVYRGRIRCHTECIPWPHSISRFVNACHGHTTRSIDTYIRWPHCRFAECTCMVTVSVVAECIFTPHICNGPSALTPHMRTHAHCSYLYAARHIHRRIACLPTQHLGSYIMVSRRHAIRGKEN